MTFCDLILPLAQGRRRHGMCVMGPMIHGCSNNAGAETFAAVEADSEVKAAEVLRADFADLETQLQQIFINHPKVPLVICGELNCDML